MAATLAWKFKLEKIDMNPDVLVSHLAADAAAQMKVLKVANEIAEAAKRKIGSNPKPPKGAQYAPLKGTGKGWTALPKTAHGSGGTYFSAAPSAVAREIKVKDATKVFKKRKMIRVALVIGDHPYSMCYERGGLGIRANRFFTAAAVGVAQRKAWLFTKHGLGEGL